MNSGREVDLLYILWGDDAFSREEKLQEIKNSLGDPSLLITNTSVLEGQKLHFKELKAACEAVPFLSARRLVMVNGLLERYEPKEKSAKPKKNSGNQEDEALQFAGIIKSFPDSTLLVLIDDIPCKGSPLKNNPLYKALAPQATVIQYPGLNGFKLKQWIQDRITRQGGSISLKATEVLMELIGGDLFTLANEINKLAAFTSGRMIEEKDVRLLVSAAREADIFALVESVMEHNSGRSEQIVQHLLQNGVAPPYILVMLARQIQNLVLIKDLKRHRKPVYEIQARLGIRNPYVWTSLSSRADKYSFDQLKEIYRKLLEADLSIKTGKMEGDLVINILVAELCQARIPAGAV
jgi:DNA polymerase III subunit delta